MAIKPNYVPSLSSLCFSIASKSPSSFLFLLLLDYRRTRSAFLHFFLYHDPSKGLLKVGLVVFDHLSNLPSFLQVGSLGHPSSPIYLSVYLSPPFLDYFSSFSFQALPLFFFFFFHGKLWFLDQRMVFLFRDKSQESSQKGKEVRGRIGLRS